MVEHIVWFLAPANHNCCPEVRELTAGNPVTWTLCIQQAAGKKKTNYNICIYLRKGKKNESTPYFQTKKKKTTLYWQLLWFNRL